MVTVADLERIRQVAAACASAARAGHRVTLFFRDETVPLICRSETAARLLNPSGQETAQAVAAILHQLKEAGDVHLSACSSSLYLWGVDPSELLPEISGARGLVAFLAEDLAEATEVISA